MEEIKEKKIKNYELNCLFALGEGQKIIAISQKISDWVSKNEGKMIEMQKEDEERKTFKGYFWIEKKYFAYPIKKNKAGFYLYSFFNVDSEKVKELSRILKLENGVLRFMITDISSDEPRLTAEAKEINSFTELAGIQEKVASDKEVSSPEVVEIEETKVGEIKTEEAELEAVEKVEETKEVEEAVEIEKIEETKEEEEAEESKVVKEAVIEEKTEPLETESPEAEVVENTDLNSEKVELVEEIKEDTKPEEEKTEEKVEDSDVLNTPVKEEEVKTEEPEARKKKESKQKKISLDDLDKRLDDILNEEIL